MGRWGRLSGFTIVKPATVKTPMRIANPMGNATPDTIPLASRLAFPFSANKRLSADRLITRLFAYRYS